MVLLKKRANLSRYTTSGAAVNQKHDGPMPVVCISMFIEAYITCDCKAVLVTREDRAWRRGDLHLPQPFLSFYTQHFDWRLHCSTSLWHPCVKEPILNCITGGCFFFFYNHVICECDLKLEVLRELCLEANFVTKIHRTNARWLCCSLHRVCEGLTAYFIFDQHC